MPAYIFYGGGILPIALGIVFDADAHANAMPDGRVLTTLGGSARWYKDNKTWASAVNEARVPGTSRRRRLQAGMKPTRQATEATLPYPQGYPQLVVLLG